MLVETFRGCPLLLRTISLDDGSLANERLAEQFPEGLERSMERSCQELEGRPLKARIRMSVSRLLWMLA